MGHNAASDTAGREDDYDDNDGDNVDENSEYQNEPAVREELAILTDSVVNMASPDSAFEKVAEQREQMMLDAADHIKMARSQRKLYQDKVEKQYSQ